MLQLLHEISWCIITPTLGRNSFLFATCRNYKTDVNLVVRVGVCATMFFFDCPTQLLSYYIFLETWAYNQDGFWRKKIRSLLRAASQQADLAGGYKWKGASSWLVEHASSVFFLGYAFIFDPSLPSDIIQSRILHLNFFMKCVLNLHFSL